MTMNTVLTDAEYKKILAACVDCKVEYCFFRAFLEHQHPSEKLIFQLKCLEILKYELSVEANKDVGWQYAAEKWVELGYAAAFAKVYDVYQSPREVYGKAIELAKAIKIIKDAEKNEKNLTENNSSDTMSE